MATRGDVAPATRIITPSAFDVTAAPRAVLRESVRLLHRVLGEEVMGNAEANARAAMHADAERARARAEVARLLARARKTGRSG